MNNNEHKRVPTPGALADEALDKVAGGMTGEEMSVMIYGPCEDCHGTAGGVSQRWLQCDGYGRTIVLCPVCYAARIQRGDVFQVIR